MQGVLSACVAWTVHQSGREFVAEGGGGREKTYLGTGTSTVSASLAASTDHLKLSMIAVESYM